MPDVTAPLRSRYQVFLIDDDSLLLDMYSLKFIERKFDVQVATNCLEALDRLEKGFVPDVMLVDIVMPGMDGIEFLQSVREKQLNKMKKIVILSNLGQKEDIERGMAAGANDYIVKANCTPSEVVDRVTHLLEHQES